jgi:serine/threonine-protein kinase
MGSVEVALERGDLGRERVVALKTLLPAGARDERHREMFLREARLAALLAHPNVVSAFAFGELRGMPFLAMEYVEGEPLSRVLSAVCKDDVARGLDPAIVALVLAQACDGLHAAHELRDVGGRPLNVVHRDVSPHNLMIAYDGRVKILDFGVAKLQSEGQETRTGEVKGKMAYMSPEQALGDELDRRSDLYSVGAVLFECLTGRRMWGSGTDMEVMRKLALEEPPRLEKAMPNAPPALAELHARLVARDPKDRPQTALEVATELRAFASSLAIDGAAVRVLMYRLFGDEALRRRTQLATALQAAAPGRVPTLRGTVEPLANPDRPTPTEPFVIPAAADSLAALDVLRARRRSPGLTVVAVALALLAGAIGALGAMRRGSVAVQPAVTATATPTVAADKTPPPDPPQRVTPPPAPPAIAPVSTASKPEGALRVAPPAKQVAPSPHMRPAGKTKFDVSKLPDVDPTPF